MGLQRPDTRPNWWVCLAHPLSLSRLSAAAILVIPSTLDHLMRSTKGIKGSATKTETAPALL